MRNFVVQVAFFHHMEGVRASQKGGNYSGLFSMPDAVFWKRNASAREMYRVRPPPGKWTAPQVCIFKAFCWQFCQM